MSESNPKSISLVGPCLTLFKISVRNLLHGKRFILLLLLFLLPTGLVCLDRWIVLPRQIQQMERYKQQYGSNFRSSTDHLEPAKRLHITQYATTYALLANFLLPFTALLLAGSVIRDEQEEQTLTYLLVRPVPRWAIFFGKLASTWLIAFLVVIFGLVLAQAVTWWGIEGKVDLEWTGRIIKMLPLLAISLAAYCSIFGLLGLLVKRTLVFGGIYIFLFEVFLANFPFVLKLLTVNYYFQVAVMNLVHSKELVPWIERKEVIPELQEGLIGLGCFIVIPLLLSLYLFSTREYRLKTPEGQ